MDQQSYRTVPTFDDGSGDTATATEWLIALKTAAVLNNWTDNRTLRAGVLRLEGAAKDWFSSFADRLNTLEDFTMVFEVKFIRRQNVTTLEEAYVESVRNFILDGSTSVFVENESLSNDIDMAWDYDARRRRYYIRPYQVFSSELIVNQFKARLRLHDYSIDDIYRMIQFDTERRAHIDGMMKTSLPSVTRTLQGLKYKYNLKTTDVHNAYTLSLSRISMAFPHVTCAYMKFCKNPWVPFTRMRNLSPGYPEHMMATAFACMIPKEAKCTKILIDAFMLYFCEYFRAQSRAYYVEHPNDRRKPRKSKSKIIENLYESVADIMRGSAFAESHKTPYLEAWNILAPNKKKSKGSVGVMKHVVDAAKAWRKFRELCGFSESVTSPAAQSTKEEEDYLAEFFSNVNMM